MDTWVISFWPDLASQKPQLAFPDALPPGRKWTDGSRVVPVRYLKCHGWLTMSQEETLALSSNSIPGKAYSAAGCFAVSEKFSALCSGQPPLNSWELACKLKCFPHLCFNLFSVFVWCKPCQIPGGLTSFAEDWPHALTPPHLAKHPSDTQSVC